MHSFRGIGPLLFAAGMLMLSGASCPRSYNPFAPSLPPVLPASPTLEQAIGAVNQNNSQITSFSSNHATLSANGISPSLRASIAYQRPQRLRLRADFMTSPELDLGSNEEGFWFWIKRNQPEAVYWCRHDRFATSAARQMSPIEPSWLIEAMGVAEFDPSLPHQGPFQLPGNKLEIRTIRETPQGPSTKVTIIDAGQGWILEQHLHDAQGRLLGSSLTSQHRQDPATGLWMPGVVQINCPLAQFSIKIELGQVQINRLSGDPAQLWSVPNYPGAPLVDMGDPSFQGSPLTMTGPPQSVQAMPPYGPNANVSPEANRPRSGILGPAPAASQRWTPSSSTKSQNIFGSTTQDGWR